MPIRSAIFTSFILTATALAHPVSLSRATIVVHRDHVDVSIEAPAEDLLHYELLALADDGRYGIEAVRDAAQRYGPMLRDGLILRDERGARMRAELASLSVECGDATVAPISTYWINATLQYVAGEVRPLRFVTFQHRPPVATQILLSRLGAAVRPADRDAAGRSIVLTSGGNAETLEFDGSAASQPVRREAATRIDARAWLGADRFQSVHAVVEVNNGGITAWVVVPATIAQTWEPVHRAQEDVIAIEEQAKLIATWRTRFANAIGAAVAGKEADVLDVYVIGPGQSERSATELTDPVSFYAARIVGCLHWKTTKPIREFDLKWQLFNEAVPAARVLVIHRDDATEFTVSSYSPEIRWHAGE